MAIKFIDDDVASEANKSSIRFIGSPPSDIISPEPGATQEFIEANLPEPETTPSGLYGAAVRGAAPYGAGAIAGGTVGGVPGAAAGIGTVALSRFVGDPLVTGVNAKFGTNFATPTEAMNKVFDYFGVERPDTATEQFFGLMAEGAASGPMSASRSMGKQMLQGLAAATAGESARIGAEQAGFGPGFQMAASLLAGMGTGIAFAPGLSVKTAPLTLEEAATLTRRAAKGDRSAQHTLAYHAADGIDPATRKAAEELGVAEYMTPGQLTTNKVIRELEAGLAEFADSSIGKARAQAVERVIKATDDTLQSLSKGDDVFDFSAVTLNTRNALRRQIAELDEVAEAGFKEVEGTVNPQTRHIPIRTLQYLEQKIANNGGGEEGLRFLSQMERQVYNKIKGFTKPGLKAGRITRDGPTYSAMDGVRRSVGLATRGKSDFKNQDIGEAKKLYSVLLEDQATHLKKGGGDEAIWRSANAAVKQRKAVEDNMMLLFGKEIDKSMASSLSTATTALAKGDAERWKKIMDAVPTEIRPRVAAGAVASMLTKNLNADTLDLQSFTNWYGGVKRNKQAYRALMGSLTPEARLGLDNIYELGRILKDTGGANNAQFLRSAVSGSSGLMFNVMMAARRAATVIGVQDLIGSRFHSQAGSYAFANATNQALLSNRQLKTLSNANRLLGSPEFRELVRAMGEGKGLNRYVDALSRSQMMISFMKQVNLSTRNEDIRNFIYQGIMPPEQPAQ
jgi:hypothetical protein